MKTQVLQLDSHDDILSTRDKLGWKQTGRVLLVWPAKGRVLTRRLDLVLLTRHAAGLGAQLALVTADPLVKENAASLGISVFESAEQAQTARWERPKHWRRRLSREHVSWQDLIEQKQAASAPRSNWQNKLTGRLIIFAVGVAAVLAIAALLLPSAEIRLEPQTLIQELELSVAASPEIQQVNISGLLPIETIPVEVEGRDSIPVSGITRVPADKASGEVTFTNLGVSPVSIPQGTIVRTLDAEPKRFTTTRSARVAAGPNSQVVIPIVAVEAGAQGNLGPGRLQAIEGPLGIELRVTNENPTAGGTLRNVPAVSQSDRQELEQRLLETLEQTAIDEFFASEWRSDLLLTPTPNRAEIVIETYSAEAGSSAEELELRLRVLYEFQIVPQAEIESLASQALDANLPENYVALPGRLEIAHLEYPTLDRTGKASWPMQVKRDIQSQPDRLEAANRAAGRTPEQVRQEFSAGMDLRQQPEIELRPGWWPRLPLLPNRIQVIISG